MLVQRVVAPVSGAVSTVVDEHFDPVGPAEAYLAHLDAIERSPNTVRACASRLRLWFEHLAGRGVAWDGVGLDDVGRFVSWLRAPAEGVIVIDAGAAGRAVATVNRHLAAVFGLYDFHARRGVRAAAELVDWRRAGVAPTSPSSTESVAAPAGGLAARCACARRSISLRP